MGWTIFEIGVNAYQAFLMIAFLRSQMEAKAAVGCKEALCFLAISGFFTLYLFWDIRVTALQLNSLSNKKMQRQAGVIKVPF